LTILPAYTNVVIIFHDLIITAHSTVLTRRIGICDNNNLFHALDTLGSQAYNSMDVTKDIIV